MSKLKNIHAYTAVGSFPAFISINVDDKGQHSVIVRSEEEGTCGQQGMINVTKSQLLEMAKDIQEKLGGSS